MSAQGRALAEAFGRLQSGLARVFMNSSVHEDGVAIHFSMPSIRGSWITDGKINAGVGGGSKSKSSANFAELENRRKAWVGELEKSGVQFRFLATAQIESGMLDHYRVLILPYSIAITDKEAKEIERFLARGGIVYGDDQAGRMDGRCHWRKQTLWDERTKGFMRSGPRNVGVQRDFGGPHLVTVRDFGHSELTGVLPEKPARIRLPEARGFRYDLLRGGIAAAELDAGPDKPVLIVERQSRIAKLSIDEDLNATLRDEHDTPVDLSVVRAEVINPDGHLVRHYSSNLTVRDGKASLQIPFAINDAQGEWRVQVRDVISGLTAATFITRK
jgi:hypothetical protein